MCDEIRSHHDWITEPLPCSPPEQTSKLFVSFAEQIPAISYWCIFVILVVVLLTGPCTFFFVDRGIMEEQSRFSRYFPCEYAVHLDMYENIDTYHVILKTTHERALHISHLYFIYAKYAYSIPLFFYESHWLNWGKRMF